MSETVKTALAITATLGAIVLLTFIIADAVNDSRAPAVECVEAPGHTLQLDSIQAVGAGHELWVCGVLLGDQAQLPAFLCYPMKDCAR